MCTTCMLDAGRGQKRLSDAQELELGVVVSHTVSVLETDSDLTRAAGVLKG